MHFGPEGRTMQQVKPEPELVRPDAGRSPLPVFEEVSARLANPRQPALRAALSGGSILAEVFRMLRLQVKTIGEHRPFRCIGIVSVASGEGKTTTALGLAAAMARQSDSRVLLIEADLRRSSIEKSLDLGPAAGLAEYLEGGGASVSVRRLGSQGFFLLSAGRASLRHPELLASARMQKLIEAARSAFDVVLLDCPPLLPVADSMLLQDVLDGLLLVVQARRVPREELRRALGRLKPDAVQGVVYRASRAILRRSERYGYRARYITDAPGHPSAAPIVAVAGGLTLKQVAAAMLVSAGVAALSVGGWLLAHRRAPAPSTPSAEAVAATHRVNELEAKLEAIQAEKAAAEVRAAEDGEKKMAEQAAARGQKPDPVAVATAKQEARRRDEQRAAEVVLAEQRRRADEAATGAVAPAGLSPTPLPPPPSAPGSAKSPPTVPSVTPGSLVSLSDPGVVPPVVLDAPQMHYPPIAARVGAEGTVELSVLVDEKGSVVDANIVTAAGGRTGLNEAAIDSVKRRRYQPASKDGVRVKVWYPISIRFVLAKG